ncbi:hypothetical protein SNOG_03464 [Parastagonospora nodorum SN15]|uniref:Uncharacterized protein n=1 Tax=Phaeosphaeria nodorum (strain SN15 / ATCC MYA-4574 / FGSC 10173) TaxID=321614 RepID=Q0UXQ0_PHANO|nr:hypothetical protein SNOG_03464 [Parastagonospora nodorum SN15]EAT88669.1 hypothetical protein SNOG_03464 [Parastagonospora nodorum SN15]
MSIALIKRIGKSEAPTIHFTASMKSEIGKSERVNMGRQDTFCELGGLSVSG